MKRGISSSLGDSTSTSAPTLVAGTVAAAGGFGAFGTGGDAGTVGAASLGRALSGLGGFAAALTANDLDAAVGALGLADLVGRPAIEVVSRIAEHLSSHASGTEAELLAFSLRRTILDAAALQGDLGYDDLEAALQSYLTDEGVPGLVEIFLTNFVLDYVWRLDEEHIQSRSATEEGIEALYTAFRHACRNAVRSFIEQTRTDGRFDRTDWFGTAGVRFALEIARALEARIMAMAEEE